MSKSLATDTLVSGSTPTSLSTESVESFGLILGVFSMFSTFIVVLILQKLKGDFK